MSGGTWGWRRSLVATTLGELAGFTNSAKIGPVIHELDSPSACRTRGPVLVPPMAKLEQPLVASDNPRLREQLIREVRGPKDRPRFSLVYERHVGGASAGVGDLIGIRGPNRFGAG